MSIRFAWLAVSLLFLPINSIAQDMDFKPISVEEDKESKAELEAALKAYKRRDFLRTSLVLHRLVSRNEVAVSPVEQKAEYTLGKTLYRLGLYQASLNSFERVIQGGREHRYFKASCKWLYYLSRKISGDPELLEKISKYQPEDCPVEFRSEMSFLLGQYHYNKGKVDQGLSFLKQVEPKSRYFPKAKFLEGLSYTRLASAEQFDQDQKRILGKAIESFKDLLRVTATSSKITEDLKYFNQLAILSMARVFYGTGEFRKAIKYFDRVPLDSVLWLEALFEASWTHFRMNNHEKALGNLHTLSSPFFNDEYLPEASILKSVIFYSNCNYEKTRETILDFRLIYEPLLNEIKGYVDSFADPSEFYEFLRKLQDSGAAISPRVHQILGAAFKDKQLKRINAYVRELDRELDLIRRSKSTWSRSQLAQDIIQATQFIRSDAVGKAGDRAKARLNQVVRELEDLISQSLKIEFEVTSAEKGILESNLQGGGEEKRSKTRGSLYATDDEHLYWPFTGEYWRDELGYYLYTIKSECSR